MNVKYLLCYGLLLACSQLSAAEGLAEDFTITISDEEVPAFDAYTPVSAAFRAELAEEWKLATRDVVNVIPVERAPKLYAILQAIVHEFATKMACEEPAVLVDVKIEGAAAKPTIGEVCFGSLWVQQCIVRPATGEENRRWRAFRVIAAHEMGHISDFAKHKCLALSHLGERLSSLWLPATVCSHLGGSSNIVTLMLFGGGILLANWARFNMQGEEYYADRCAMDLEDRFTPEELEYAISLCETLYSEKDERYLVDAERRLRRGLGNCRGGCFIITVKSLFHLKKLLFTAPTWISTHPSVADRVAALSATAVSRDTIAFDDTSATDKKTD